MTRILVRMTGVAALAALAVFPLTQPSQSSPQPVKPQLQASVDQPSSPPQALSRDGRVVRVVYPVLSGAR